MDSILSKILAILIGAFTLIFIFMFFIETNIENIKLYELENDTKHLVETIIYKGCISKDVYDNYLKKLSYQGNFKVDVIVKRDYISKAKQDKEIEDILGTIYDIRKQIFTEYTLQKDIETKGLFQCKIGDEIMINVRQQNESDLSYILKKIFKINIQNVNVRYCGVIKNELL